MTFDQHLHFGEHCARLRRKTKPRVVQLRKLTAGSWGLREPQLRTVANGYARGALEYAAAAAWLPATSESHVEFLEREMRAATRVVIGSRSPVSTPKDPLMAEAGMVPVRTRREVLTARLAWTAASQREDDPLRALTTNTRPGMSTGAAMLDVVTYVTENIDRGLVTSLVTADTSKAFDSVEHPRLLDKLGWYGIRPDWFADWLRGRSQSIGSSHLSVTHRVIQGSILGPVLFLLFTNDLTQHLTQGKVVMYADDVQFLDADTPSNILALKKRVEDNLSVAMKWFTQNRLKINPSKTEMIVLKSRRRTLNTNFSVRFGSDTVSPSQSVRVLGVTIDSCLAWEAHVTSVVQRCNMILVGLARMRNRVPKDTKRMLVESLVFPHIRYCISVWGSCCVSQKKRIQKVINFGARVVSGLNRREHVTPVLNELGWESVDDMVRVSDLAVIRHLLTSNSVPEILRSKLVLRSDESSRRTRATDGGQLQLPRVNTEFARRGFLFRASKHWNEAL